MKKIAIIGAGAAGLTAAIVLARKNIKVEIFEQNEKNAKKILVSGNGHCNITNKNIAPIHYISQNPKFVEHTLKQFGFHELEKFMNSIGLLLFSKDDGKTYPLSYEAKSVINAFEETLQNLDVTIYNDHRVTSFTKDETFTLTCKDKTYSGYDSVIVASGLKAAPQLGGNDDGLSFATAFDHNIIELYPSLVGLHTDCAYNEMLSGVKIHGEVSIYVDKFKEKTISGDILFTNYGLSGLAILDISQIASKALLNYQEVEISLNLINTQNPQSLSAQILALCKAVPQNSLFAILGGIIPIKLALVILKATNIDSALKASEVNPKIIKGIVNRLQNFKVRVTDTHGYKHAEVCGGGVDTLEIDEKTFESKKVKRLYFIGEVLDVIGERGGYNFQFAFASGFLCAQEITKLK